MLPATTGAALATTKALPALAGQFDGAAIRVPVPVGSIADVVAVTARPVTRDEVNDIFREEAASDRYQGILGVADDPPGLFSRKDLFKLAELVRGGAQMAVIYEGATEETRKIVHHHAVLRRGLERRSGALCEAVESGVAFERLMTTLREYMADQILPHARAEERTLYQAAAAQARGSDLVGALTAEHHALVYLAGRLRPGTGCTEAAALSEWIATLFAGHVARVNDLLLPVLTGSGADLAALLADMHQPPPSPAPAWQPETYSQP